MKRTGALFVAIAMLLVGAGTASAAPPARDTEAGCPASRVVSAGFGDTVGSTFEGEIDCVVWWGVASGRSATSYGPSLTTNRGQMATFLANLIREAGGDLPTDAPSAFGDVGASAHRDNIDALAAVGVVAGTGADAYSPSRSVTREQMATFIFRTYRYLTGEVLTSDEDAFGDDAGSVHESTINAIAAVGITGGNESGDYQPRAFVTRGAMAAFLARTLDLLVDTGVATPPPLPDTVLGYDLSRVARSDSGVLDSCNGYDQRIVSIDGQLQERSLSCTLRSNYGTGWEEYNLARDFQRFRAVVGQTDDSDNVARTIRFTVYGDGEVLFSQNLAFGQSTGVDVDVTGVLRLRLEVADLSTEYMGSGSTRIGWGTPTVGG